jgi:cell division protein FtsA
MKTDEFVVGLDLGTTKISTVVGQLIESPQSESGFQVKILAVGKAPSQGIKKGVIVNIDATVEGMRKSIEEAELMAGVDISKVVIGVGGSHIKGLNSTGVVGIKGREIERGDIERVIDAARAVAIPADRTSLHVLPQEFKVDDQDGIRDPLGMMGTRLESKVHIVTAAQSALQNIVRCCQRVNITPVGYVLQPLASAKAVLSHDETELGVALIDIGGGTTDIAIFQNGSIVHTAVLPLGGSHVSQDLAIGLRTPQLEAERLKILSGCALKTMISSSETVEVPSVGGRPARVVDRKLIGEIIEPRLEEILQLANREIISSGYADVLGAGVVLTGGSTLMPGVIELSEFIFDLPVKRAMPEGLIGFSDLVASPIYSTGVGLVHWGLGDKTNFSKKSVGKNQAAQKLKDQFKTWFGDLF